MNLAPHHLTTLSHHAYLTSCAAPISAVLVFLVCKQKRNFMWFSVKGIIKGNIKHLMEDDHWHNIKKWSDHYIVNARQCRQLKSDTCVFYLLVSRWVNTVFTFSLYTTGSTGRLVQPSRATRRKRCIVVQDLWDTQAFQYMAFPDVDPVVVAANGGICFNLNVLVSNLRHPCFAYVANRKKRKVFLFSGGEAKVGKFRAKLCQEGSILLLLKDGSGRPSLDKRAATSIKAILNAPTAPLWHSIFAIFSGGI